ncbi:PTS sugar transporter subunit IIB [Corynebacterium pyruviciproducens]|uniref:PTS sugar transporter subunit IIB n=1 Tax=Corynebacterium pyruviciproducens TaxID=598660 RepID=A0AAF1BYV5_9CORY|nr:PTS sugar transporter subunit IIB [Corynebacterium pyruviciproducens]MDK6566899.1 PTS sugar transporter subunit IIB [Corynebacterium pyruviciproducens]WOT02045.1 PTS sugar transporter subunit IIB [Corynebacterium pyruviciproducens]
MKFQAMCSSGLGSSFLVEMNIKQALENIGLTDFEVSHSDIGGATKNDADVFIVGRDLEDATKEFTPRIVLNSIIDKEELEEKLRAFLQENGQI